MNIISHNKNLFILIGIILLNIFSHFILVANPGFYSHDEWQKFDHVTQKGLVDFIFEYGKVKPGPEFGFPVRPVGFIQQGISSIWMKTNPYIPHLIDVLIHSVVALTLYILMLGFNAKYKIAILCSILFSLSPLTTFAVGWVGASFDQWFTLFLCITLIFILKLCKNKNIIFDSIVIMLSTSLAILSKETAIMLPALLLLINQFCISNKIFKRAKQGWGESIYIVGIISLPIFIYLAIRFPAIINTLDGNTVKAYTPSLSNITYNFLYYFSYPFMPFIADLNAIRVIGTSHLIFGLTLHLIFLSLILYFYGIRNLIFYFTSYFIFLIPIISISNIGAHYLYISAIPMSIALAFLLAQSYEKKLYFIFAIIVTLTTILIIHQIYIQNAFYNEGRCQKTFLESLDSLMVENSNVASEIYIKSKFGAPEHIAIRTIFSREKYSGGNGLPKIIFVSSSLNNNKNNSTKIFVMNLNCKLIHE